MYGKRDWKPETALRHARILSLREQMGTRSALPRVTRQRARNTFIRPGRCFLFSSCHFAACSYCEAQSAAVPQDVLICHKGHRVRTTGGSKCTNLEPVTWVGYLYHLEIVSDLELPFGPRFIARLFTQPGERVKGSAILLGS